ncbi:MAG: ferric reductase-like transmembrane domain-containing protein [Candidatus Diapherotrites archaeon]
MPKLFEGAKKNWKFVLSFLVISLVFWLIQYAFQVYVLGITDDGQALVRASAFSGATFITLSLLSSIIFKFKPTLAKYWTVRRLLGVMGWLFIALHFNFVIDFYYMGNPAGLFFDLNPFANLIIFGLFGYFILLLLTLTSTDWAVGKLGAKWKPLHRLVYFSYWAIVTHFMLINPLALMNLAGYLLLLLTGLTLLGELYWFIKIAGQKNFKTKATIVAIILFLLYLISIYFGYLVN